ncbi:hypothetical protein BaRGS_00009750, partial [Batillaria attramentaria]
VTNQSCEQFVEQSAFKSLNWCSLAGIEPPDIASSLQSWLSRCGVIGAPKPLRECIPSPREVVTGVTLVTEIEAKPLWFRVRETNLSTPARVLLPTDLAVDVWLAISEGSLSNLALCTPSSDFTNSTWRSVGAATSYSTSNSDTEYQKAIITVGVLAGALIIAVIIAKIVDYCYDHHIAINDNASDISEHTRNLIRARLVVSKLGNLRRNKQQTEPKTDKPEENSRKIIRIWSARAKESRRIAEQRRQEEQAKQLAKRNDLVIKVEEATGEAKLKPGLAQAAANLMVINETSPRKSPKETSTLRKEQQKDAAESSPQAKPAPLKRTLTGINSSLRASDSTGFAQVSSAGNAAVLPKEAFVEPESSADGNSPPQKTEKDSPKKGDVPQIPVASSNVNVPLEKDSKVEKPNGKSDSKDTKAKTASNTSGTSPGTGLESNDKVVNGPASSQAVPTDPSGTGASKSSGNTDTKAGITDSKADCNAKETPTGESKNEPCSSVKESDGRVSPKQPARPVSGVSRKLFSVVLPNQMKQPAKVGVPGTSAQQSNKGSPSRTPSPTKVSTASPSRPGPAAKPRPKSFTQKDSPSYPSQMSRSVSIYEKSNAQLQVHKNPANSKKAAAPGSTGTPKGTKPNQSASTATNKSRAKSAKM